MTPSLFHSEAARAIRDASHTEPLRVLSHEVDVRTVDAFHANAIRAEKIPVHAIYEVEESTIGAFGLESV